jgi:signal transduction histidine kinase
VITTSFEEEAARPRTITRPSARLSVLAEVGLLLSSASDHVTILQKLADISVPALGEWCSVHVAEPGGQLARLAVRASPPETDAACAARVFASGESEAATGHVAVPLVVRGRSIGVLAFGRADHVYDREDLAFADELARRVAMYLDNALLLRALRDEAARLETLNGIGQELAATHDLDEVIQKVCEAATALTGAEIGVCFTQDGKLATCGINEDEHARLAPTFESLEHLPRVRSYLAVPVRGRRGDVIGGIALGHSRQGAFDSRAEQLVTGLASLTATATDSARLFREARELIAALAKSNRDLDQFAYVTSHDLRAPLRGIANLASWIDEDLGERLSEGGREHMRLLRNRVQRLEDIIQGVLAYSRAGRSDEEPTEIELGALVREVVELLAPPARAEILISKNLPTLHAPRVPLQQVLLNLVGNALKYNHGDHPTIEIGAEPCADGWEIYVRDNGPGIEPRYHAQIWGLFQTLVSRDKHESSGIGLAIVRKIVEAHGGRAWVESDEGKGATFRFTWPKALPPQRTWR